MQEVTREIPVYSESGERDVITEVVQLIDTTSLDSKGREYVKGTPSLFGSDGGRFNFLGDGIYKKVSTGVIYKEGIA